jgi:hypothetical protein
VLSAVATVVVLVMAVAAVVLSADNTPERRSTSPTTTRTAGTTKAGGTAMVAEVTAAFDLDDECTATGDEVRCRPGDTTAEGAVTTTFTRHRDAAAAGDALDDLVSRAEKADPASWTSEYHAAPPAAGARKAPAGRVLGTFADTTTDPTFGFVATNEKLDSYLVAVEGDDYDAAERKLISLITDGTVPTAADVFGAAFGLAGFRACWPNLDWFTVIDGSLPDFDCFGSAAGAAGAGEIRGRYTAVTTTFAQHVAASGPAGATVLKDTTWSNAAQPGVARGPYVLLDEGGGGGWRYRLVWADDGHPGLVAQLRGDDLVALEQFWADQSAARP